MAPSIIQRRADSEGGLAFIPLDRAELVALWLETLLYGAFVPLFLVTIYALVYKRSTDRVNKPMLITSIVIFILATIHVSIDLARCIEAFVDSPQGALAYFGNLAHFKHLFKTAVYATETIVADGLVVYRLYIVWGRNAWVAFVPALLVLGNVVTGYGVTYELSRLADTTADIFLAQLTAWITGFFTITLTTNVLCTLLIAYRIYSTHKSFNGGSSTASGDLNSVIQIVVESGAIYSTVLVIQIIVYLLHSNAQYTVLDPISPIIGITFSLIIIRVGLGLTHGGSGGQSDKITNQSLPQFSRSATAGAPYPLRPIAVNVTQGIHAHVDEVGHLPQFTTPSISIAAGKTGGARRPSYSDEDLTGNYGRTPSMNNTEDDVKSSWSN